MAALIEGPLAAVLKGRREEINRLVREADAVRAFDGDAFALHLAEAVAPAMETLARHDPAATERVGGALIELSLDLVARSLVGPSSPRPQIEASLRRLLPLVPHLLRLDARRVAGSVVNAASSLSTISDDAAASWIARMETLCGAIEHIDAFRDAGRVAAWRGGMAELRSVALAALPRIPPQTAASLLGVDLASIESTIALLERDRWLDPSRPAALRELALVHRIGTFRGFGGPFITPPRVALSPEGVVVSDSEKSWLVVADRFGARLIPGAPSKLAAAGKTPSLEAGGHVRLGDLSATLPELEETTSAVATADSVVATSRYSHTVSIIAAVN